MHSRAGAAVLTAILLLMTGCAAAESFGSDKRIRTVVQTDFFSPGQPLPAPLQLPDVTGQFGTPPKVAAGVGPAPSEPTRDYITVGTGQRVIPGTRPQVRYVQTDWKTGAVSHDSWAAGIPSEILPLNDDNLNIISFLDGVEIGSRIELINPTGNGDASVYVIDIIAQAKQPK